MATFLVSAQAALTRGSARAWLLGIGAVLAGVAVLANLLQQHRFRQQRLTLEQVAIDAEAAFTLTINGVFAPITSYLGELASTATDADRAHVAGQVSPGGRRCGGHAHRGRTRAARSTGWTATGWV